MKPSEIARTKYISETNKANKVPLSLRTVHNFDELPSIPVVYSVVYTRLFTRFVNKG